MKKVMSLLCAMTLAAPLCSLGLEVDAIPAVRRIYTPEMITAMKENQKDSPEWKKRYASTIAEADKLLKLSQEQWDEMVPDPRIPRAFMVHINGCPNCGDAVYKFGGYPWIITPEKPFKVQCPNCKNIYPDNDYYGYVKSGFTDKSKLTGKYADDGWGWKSDKENKKYWFVGYYNHWMYKRRTVKAMEHLHVAYILTGKPEYARMCTYLLWRLAGFWTQYDYQKQSRYALEFQPTYTGRITNLIWDAIDSASYPVFYDGVLPFLMKPDAEMEKLTGLTNEQLRFDIEEKLFRQTIRDIWSKRIHGNFGMDQEALIKLALILKESPGEPSSKEVIKRLCTLGEWTPAGETPLDYMFCNLLTTDGVPLESPSYNRHWCACLLPVFSELAKLDKDYFTDNIRLKQLLLHFNPMIIGKKNSQALGDCGNYRAGMVINGADTLLIGFDHYKLLNEEDESLPELAAALQIAAPGFDVVAQGVRPDKEALNKALGKLDPYYFYTSRHMPGAGYLTIQNRNLIHPAGIGMQYRVFPGHYHFGLLHFELFSRGTALTPDFGYPDTASGMDPRREGWFLATATHNTVVVNAKTQGKSPEIICSGYDSGDFVEYAEVDAAQEYGIKQYRRSLVTLKVDDERLIAVDFFRVDGGNQHDYFFHGNGPGISADIKMEKQKDGTLAGPDVPYGKFYDDPKYRDAKEGSVMYGSYRGSGYQYLFDVSKGSMKDHVTKVHMHGGTVKEGENQVKLGVDFYNVPDGEETLILSQGRLQKNIKQPESVGFMTRRRTGKNLRSNFISVIDFGAQPGCVEKVEALEHGFERAAVQITLKDGRKLIVFNNQDAKDPAPLKVGSFKLEGKTGALELDKDGVRRMWLYREGKISEGDKTLLATQSDFQSKVTHFSVLRGWATMQSMAPWCRTEGEEERWVFDGFRAYRTRIQSNTITFYPEIPVRGMFKLKSCDPVKKSAVMVPVPNNLHRNLYWIAPDGRKTIGRVKAEGATITLLDPDSRIFDPQDTVKTRKYAARDYYLSEIGAGQTLTIHDAARWTREEQE